VNGTAGTGSDGGGNGGDTGVLPTAGTVNTGGGGGGGTLDGSTIISQSSAAGGSGIVILRYPTAYTITLGAGLTGTTSTDGADKVTVITAGSDDVSWAVA
jgi:hypothetical protein